MRLAYAAATIVALAFAQSASAGEVTLTPVSFTPRFEATVDRDLGSIEADALRATVMRDVSAALARRGATVSENAPVTIDIAIVDADPNLVTIRHLRSHPLLDAGRTVALGGAELHAVLRSSDGAALREVNYRHYDTAFTDLAGAPATWTSANRTIATFAERVADAYVAETGAR